MGKMAQLCCTFTECLSKTHGTVQKVVFSYAYKYGWAIAHRKRKKLICNIFAKNKAFTVMINMQATFG